MAPPGREKLESVLADPGAILAFLQQQAVEGDREALRRSAAILSAELPPSRGRPLAGHALSAAGAHDEAIEAYESWLPHEDAPAALHLAQLCRSYSRLGDLEGVYRTARLFHPWDLDFGALSVADRALGRVSGQGVPRACRTCRVALLATFNTASIETCLRVGALRLGLVLDLYVAGFDQLRAEVANPNSGLYAHEPEFIVLATSWRDVEPGRSTEEQGNAWAQIWELLLGRTQAHVLQHTFDRPVVSSLGHLEARDGASRRASGIALNRHLAEIAPERVSFVDYEQAVFRFGASRWCDSRQWHWAKEAVSSEAAPHLVEEYLALLRALTGETKKLCVLDLDNTLWGGVVGEEGVGGLALGPPSATGEAYQDLQRYLLSLKEQGVLLAVCSKNNPEDARAPFEQSQDMVLSLDDCVAFEASWEPKPAGLIRISRAVGLGLDSFVFIDDNPAERALMRQELPEVWTLPMPTDPTSYVDVIHRSRAFETVGVSVEDRSRTQHYAGERKRTELRQDSGSMEGYLQSLEMEGRLSEFVEPDFARIVQLAGRSNQFNLTTWRLTRADVEQLADSEGHRTRTLRLKDRFGDHGLIMLYVCEIQDQVLRILAWMMSCRVLGRGVEQLAMRDIHEVALAAGCESIEGVHIPTKKNVLVADLYSQLGFQQTETGQDGATTWTLRVADTVSYHPVFVDLDTTTGEHP